MNFCHHKNIKLYTNNDIPHSYKDSDYVECDECYNNFLNNFYHCEDCGSYHICLGCYNHNCSDIKDEEETSDEGEYDEFCDCDEEQENDDCND
jgi:hypothetical protein